MPRLINVRKNAHKAKHACRSGNHDVNRPLCSSAEKKSLKTYITYADFFIYWR